MKENNEQLRSVEEILRQPKYAELKNLVLICEAMDEHASQFKSHSPIEQKPEDILKEFIKKETEYLQSCNPTNEFGDITGNDFAAGVVTGMNRLYNESGNS